MRCTYACDSPEHLMARRKFLAGMAATAAGSMVGGLGVFTRPAAARQLEKDQKRIVVFNMHGGLSQLESWDPKPGTETGGPFRAIETSVPGIRISELLPNVAKQMHHLCLVRGVNTAEDDHGKGAYMMMTGRRQTPAADYPVLGAVCAKAMAPESAALPGHIVITPGGGGGRGNDSAYLGPKYASIHLGNGKPPQYTTRPGQLNESMDAARHDFRRRVNDRFLSRRRTAVTEAYTYSYEQALQLMKKKDVFDVSQGAGQGLRALRQVRPRPALPAGAPAAREGRDVRPGLAFELRHAQRELQLPHRAARRVRPVVRRVRGRPRRPGDARQHPDRRPFGVRPDAEHQLPLRPRPLVARLDRGDGRRAGPSGRRVRQDQRQGDRGRRRPGRSRATSSTPTSRPSGSTRPTRSTSRAATSRSPTRRRR